MIEGNKISLRPILLEDVSFLNLWKNDEMVFTNLGGGFMPISLDQQKKWMDDLIDNTGANKRFIIIDKSNYKPIGFIGIYSINNIHRTSNLGVYIGDKTYWGKGIGTEACELILKFSHDVLNLRKISLQVVSDNIAAIKMYEKLQFKRCGCLIKERYIKGEYKDLIIMERFL